MCAGGQRGACHPRAPPGAMRSGAGLPDQFLVSPGAQFMASLDTAGEPAARLEAALCLVARRHRARRAMAGAVGLLAALLAAAAAA
jgi:hypothetical protein